MLAHSNAQQCQGATHALKFFYCTAGKIRALQNIWLTAMDSLLQATADPAYRSLIDLVCQEVRMA